MDTMISATKNRGPAPDLIWLSLGIILSVIPHSFHIPVWSTLMFACLMAIRLLLSEKVVTRYFVSTYFFRLLIGGIVFTGVFTTFGTMVGRDAGVTLLVLLGGLKLLEIRSERDYFISSFIGFLLILTNFFYTQTLPVSLFMGFTLLVLLAALISFNDQDSTLNLRGRMGKAFILFLHALPLMILMFLLFPRVSGPLWGLPKDAQSGITGIDDVMTPGSISELILSDEVAFRVAFDGPVPDKSSLYWRGPVLWHTDGFKWVPDRPERPEDIIVPRSEAINYVVTLEPTDKNWLFALDIPVTATEDSYLWHDLQIRTRKPVINRVRYDMRSYTEYTLLANNREELDNALQLPGDYHPRTVALARSWRAEGLGDRELINRALTHFNEEAFFYTLTPPIVVNDSVDEFMFESRQGFCEHYAAAFTILMRAAGIPARVVTGYQGGTVNPVGQYLIVYQRDAHAWTEVWLGESRGWVRIDPTSAVSPSRVTDGIQSAIPDTLIRVPLGLYNNSFARNIWERMNNTFDAINNRWNQWVLGYDRNRQRMLFNRFGLELNRDELMAGMFITVFLCLCITAYGLFNVTRQRTDTAKHYYNRFKRKLSRAGLRIYDHEGPRDLADRASRFRKDLSDAVNEITDTYIKVRYRNQPDDIESLKLQVNAFRPRPAGTP